MTVTDYFVRRAGAALFLVAALGTPPRAQAQDSLPQTLTLGDAARLAAQQSTGALTARYRAEQAGARAQQQRAALLPSLSTSATRGGNTFNTVTFGIPFPGFDPNGTVIGPVNTVDIRATASVPIFDLANIRQLRSAQTSVNASRATAASAAQQAAAAAATAYLGTLRAAAQIDARRADSVLADSLLGIARQQLQAGVGVALDVTRAQAQLASIRAQLISARNARDRARLNLLRALGLPLSAELSLADSLATLPIVDTLPMERAAVERAIQHRPDLRAADQQLLATEQAASAIRGERLPSLAVFGNEGVLGGGLSPLLNTYTWGIAISLPIFDGFRRTGRAEEQDARVKEIEVQRQDLRRQISTEVRGALLDMASARQQLGAARERLRLAEQEVTQAQERFRAGVAGNADVITASLDLNSSRNQVIDALTAYQSARVSLAQAEGAVTSLP
jgi:outer membrane protein TolC